MQHQILTDVRECIIISKVIPFNTAEDLSVNAAPDWHSSLSVSGEEEFEKCEVKT